MITLLSAPPSRQVAATPSMSRSTVRRSPDLSAPMLMTMSTSRGAVEDHPPRLVLLDVGGRRAEREPDDRADADARSAQQPRAASATQAGFTQTVAKRNSRGLAAQRLDLRSRRLRLEQRVVDEAGDVARTAASRVQTQPGGPGVDQPADAARTAVVEDAVAAAVHGRCRRPAGWPSPRR